MAQSDTSSAANAQAANSACRSVSQVDIQKIGVFGCGTWGVALARLLAQKGYQITIWAESPERADELNASHALPQLPGVQIPEEITFTNDYAQTTDGADALLFVVSSPYVRDVAKSAAPYITGDQILISATKGVESSTGFTMTEVIVDELKAQNVSFNEGIVALSGPTHAEEVARDLPSAMIAASKDTAMALVAQNVFSSNAMRVYADSDIRGVQLCGAFKNIIALACGIAKGLGMGDNAQAALMTRGLAEMMRLGRAQGCDERTFVGLAGVGDIIVTATSEHSRNARAGRLLAQGIPVDQVRQQVGMVVEGLNVLPAALNMMKQYDIEMPILETVDAVVNGSMSANDAIESLMSRPLTFEKD